MIYALYTDDSILAGPNRREIDETINAIKAADLDITVEGDISDFLGVHNNQKDDGTIHLTQPQLIDKILKELRLTSEHGKVKDTPAASSKLLSRHSNSPDFDKSFNYRSIIGMLGYLETT